MDHLKTEEWRYLGDSVYAKNDGHGVLIGLNNGEPYMKSVIYFDGDTTLSLIRFIGRAFGVKITVERPPNDQPR